MLNIALDFDGTYTAAPDYWDKFIEESPNWDIRIVTFRDEELHGHPALNWLRDVKGVPVIFTNGNAKKDYCRDKFDWNPDIWIDDNPHLISTQIPAWTREENILWANEVNSVMIKEWVDKYPERVA